MLDSTGLLPAAQYDHFSFHWSTQLVSILGIRSFDRLHAIKALHYIPHIKHPRSYNEKVLHRKFFKPFPKAEVVSDKWKVRDHVKTLVGDDILNEVYCVASTPDELDFQALPNEFVIKMNNASKRNIIVLDKRIVNTAVIKAQLLTWLETPFGLVTNEPWYFNMKPMIVVERYLRDSSGHVPNDYSFHVFHGETKFIESHIDRFGTHSSNWYDTDWNLQDIQQGTPNGPVTPRPRNLADMIDIANRLANGADFIRVDLFSVDDVRTVFLEITVAPCAGLTRFRPMWADFYLGSFW